MSIKHWVLIGFGGVFLAGGGYLLGSGSEVVTPATLARPEAAKSEMARTPEPKVEAAREQVQLEVAMIAYAPQGCRVDPDAMGCGLYPIPVVRITNKGDQLQLVKIAVNKRYDDPNCVMTIGKTIQTGDSWMSEGNPKGESPNPMEEYARGLRGELVDFRKHCGDQVVFLDVATDKGVKQYEFGNR